MKDGGGRGPTLPIFIFAVVVFCQKQKHEPSIDHEK